MISEESDPDLIAAEVARILDSKLFRSSPVLAHLLAFLSAETIAGRGRDLKSYTVAVEGLGRRASFDAQADSYPRVQIARLRKALDAYYADPVDGGPFKLEIPLGNYYVRLVERPDAEPDALREEQVAQTLIAQQSSRPAKSVIGIAVVMALLLVGAIAARVVQIIAPPGIDGINSAMVVVTPMAHPKDAQSRELAQYASTKIFSGLGRAWVARFYQNEADLPFRDNGNVYRLETSLALSEQNQHLLTAHLIDQQTAIQVWSTTVVLPAENAGVDHALNNVIAALAGSYSAITRAEGNRLRENWSPGYACQIQFLRFLAVPSHDFRQKVGECLEQNTSEARLQSVIEGSRIWYALMTPTSDPGRTLAIIKARARSLIAARNYPSDYYVLTQAARFSLGAGDCEQGRRYAKLAIDGNPNDPLIAGYLGVAILACSGSDPDHIVDHAYSFELPGDGSALMPKILMAIRMNRRDRLEVIASTPLTPTPEQIPYLHFCNAFLYAGLDNREAAIRNWTDYKLDMAGVAKSTDALVGRFIVLDKPRAGAVAFLRSKGVAE